MKRRAVFLDLNGTLVMPLKRERLSELTLIEGTDQALARLSRAGFICPVVTVQSRIAKGLFSEEEFRAWFDNFASLLHGRGAEIVGPYVCPHRYSEPCRCKKPSSLLYERAATEHAIDLRTSFVIGDTAEDVCAANRFGGQGCLVRTGWAAIQPEAERAALYASYVASSLDEAVTWILSRRSEGTV